MVILEPYVVLGDGSKLDAQIGYYNKQLHIWIKGKTLKQAYSIFTNAKKTAEIRFIHGRTQDIYKGFDQLIYIKQGDITTDVWLIGENTEITSEPITEEEDDS